MIIFEADIRQVPVSLRFAENQKKYYFSANIFYSGVKPYIRSKIVQHCKYFLLPYFESCPMLSSPPYKMMIQFFSPQHTDLDNKAFFWRKIVQDMLGERKKTDSLGSIRLGRIKDDSTEYFNASEDRFFHTKDKRLIISIIKERN